MTARWQVWLLVTTTCLAAIVAHRFSPSQATALVGLFLHSLHGPGFAAIALLAYWSIGPTRPSMRRYIVAGGSAAAIAVISEIAQIPGPRDAQISDLVVDALGILGALGILAVVNENVIANLTRVQRGILALSSTVALTAAIAPSAWYGYVLVWQRASMPALLAFERQFESPMYWQTANLDPLLVATPENWPVDSRTALRAREDGEWGILVRIHPYPDWSEYSALTFVAASTSDEVHEVAVGIRDIAEKPGETPVRYYTNIIVGPEPETYRIALADVKLIGGERPFDLAHVEALVLSASRPGGSVEIIVDEFRLEP